LIEQPASIYQPQHRCGIIPVALQGRQGHVPQFFNGFKDPVADLVLDDVPELFAWITNIKTDPILKRILKRTDINRNSACSFASDS
jgi:hypothetical protein